MSRPEQVRQPPAKPSAGPGPGPGPADDGGRQATWLTVDEISTRTGISVRTIRFYASRRLLPPPRLQGRVGYYGDDHLARLELVQRLQELGFTLAAIEEYLSRIAPGTPPEDVRVLGALMTPWTVDVPEELTRAELAERLGRPLSTADLALLEAFGVLTRTGRRFRVAPALLELGADLLDVGLDVDAARRSRTVVDTHTRQIMAELNAIFREQVWGPYRAGPHTAAQRRQLSERTERLRSATLRATVIALQQALNETIRASVQR
ncbi:MAG TPA: MerR family transcriptional regulator [Kineosporiaceae bacterium]|nr:MerR family transcriptional regulator [Kineosporiaceae bacterium]